MISLDDISSPNDDDNDDGDHDDDQVLHMHAWNIPWAFDYPILPGSWLSRRLDWANWTSTFPWESFTRYESKRFCTSEGLPGPGWNPKDGDAWRLFKASTCGRSLWRYILHYFTVIYTSHMPHGALTNPSFRYKMKVCSFCRGRISQQMGWVLFIEIVFGCFWSVLCSHLLMRKAWWTAKQRRMTG